jgi:hypothetical protein
MCSEINPLLKISRREDERKKQYRERISYINGRPCGGNVSYSSKKPHAKLEIFKNCE